MSSPALKLNPADPNDDWRLHATPLAAWVLKSLVNRLDAYGSYYRKDGKTTPTTKKEAKDGPLTLAKLVRHFSASGPKATDEIIGLHAIALHDEGECLCKWVSFDVDRHGEEGDEGANLEGALALYGMAIGLGFRPLLLESNGRGGYHLVLIFEEPIPSRLAFTFAQWMIRDWESIGFAEPPEAFPKQPEIGPGKFGNWMRLPGRHHTREFWSRVYSNGGWLEGREAIKFILATGGTPESSIPEEARPNPDAQFDLGREIERKRGRADVVNLEGRPRRAGPDDGTLEPGEDFNARATWSEILTPHGWKLDHEDEGTGYWTRPGKSGGTSATTDHNGNDTLYVFTSGTSLVQHDSYSKFGAYTALNHGGVWKEATAVLSSRGYGTFAAWTWNDEAGSWGEDIRQNPCPKGGWIRLRSPGKQAPPPPNGARIRGDRDARQADRNSSPTPPGDRETTTGGPSDDLPEIIVSTDEFRVNDLAIAALTTDPEVFCRGNYLVIVKRDAISSKLITRPAETPRIAALQRPSIRERISKNARWVKWRWDKEAKAMEKVAAHPPDWSTAAIEARGHWPGMRPLEGVVEAPTLRPDGSILDERGYDGLTGLLYEPNCDFPPIPSRISQADARAAAELILEVVADFPFAVIRDEKAGTDDRGAGHRAAYLAGLLTPLARYAIDGPCPLFLGDANSAASGKTKLCDIVAILATGRLVARSTYPESNEEMEKRIISIALEGDRMILLDNVATGAALGGAALDAALTATTVKGRLLGRSEMSRELPMYTVWYATGNNLGLKGDALRRVVPYRLESKEERPEERDDFRIQGEILDHVKRRRGELVVAALTILRGYILAGKPPADPKLTPMDYPAWCGLVRQAIYWALRIDPCATRKGLIADDPETNLLKGLIAGWAELPKGESGCTASEAVRLLNDPANEDKFSTLRDVLLEWSRDGGIPSPKAIGVRLKMIKGKVLDKKTMKSIPYKGTQSWRVVSVLDGGSGGSGGSVSIPRGQETSNQDSRTVEEEMVEMERNNSHHSHHSHQDDPDREIIEL